MEQHLVKMRQIAAQPRRPDRAQLHLILEDLVPANIKEEYDDIGADETFENPDHLEDLLMVLRGSDLKRGDIIGIESMMTYRNEGKLIFDGQNLQKLADEPDEYGSIPSEFMAIIEFPPFYWCQIIEHNYWVPFDITLIPNWRECIVLEGNVLHYTYTDGSRYRFMIYPDDSFESDESDEPDVKMTLIDRLSSTCFVWAEPTDSEAILYIRI